MCLGLYRSCSCCYAYLSCVRRLTSHYTALCSFALRPVALITSTMRAVALRDVVFHAIVIFAYSLHAFTLCAGPLDAVALQASSFYTVLRAFAWQYFAQGSFRFLLLLFVPCYRMPRTVALPVPFVCSLTFWLVWFCSVLY